MSLVELVLDVNDHFERRGVQHAFGGALALAYYADPRGTIDIDVNVFAPVSDAESVVADLDELGLGPERPAEQWVPMAGVRLVRESLPVALDLFFSIDDHYGEMAARVQRFPFGTDRTELPFLSREDLAIFKLSFGRDKDWVDLRRLAQAQPDMDLPYIQRQVVALRGPTMYPRVARLRQWLRQ